MNLAFDEALAKINLLVQTRLSDESEPASAWCRAGLILGRPQPQRWTMDDVLKHIRGLEAARFSAMKQGDLDELDAILDDNIIYVHSNGRIDSKAEYLETLRQGAIHYEAIEVKGDRHQIGKDSAVLVQSVIATMRVGVGRELSHEIWCLCRSGGATPPGAGRLAPCNRLSTQMTRASHEPIEEGPQARRPGDQDDRRQHPRCTHRLVHASWLRADRRDRPFPYGENRFGIPKPNDLHFVVLRKLLG